MTDMTIIRNLRMVSDVSECTLLSADIVVVQESWWLRSYGTALLCFQGLATITSIRVLQVIMSATFADFFLPDLGLQARTRTKSDLNR